MANKVRQNKTRTLKRPGPTATNPQAAPAELLMDDGLPLPELLTERAKGLPIDGQLEVARHMLAAREWYARERRKRDKRRKQRG